MQNKFINRVERLSGADHSAVLDVHRGPPSARAARARSCQLVERPPREARVDA
jgi:hypothetical protein